MYTCDTERGEMAQISVAEFEANPEEGLMASGSFRKTTQRAIGEHCGVEMDEGATKRDLGEGGQGIPEAGEYCGGRDARVGRG